MNIWKTKVSTEQLNKSNSGCIHEALGIEFTEIGKDFLEASMPVNARTKNPIGILHGGASAVLAESLGSVASMLVAGWADHRAVGIEISASHLSSAQNGIVYGRAKPIRLGRSLHVWEVRIRREEDPASELICLSRLTVMIKGKP